MDNRGVARMKPATLESTCRSLGIIVVAFHNDVAARHNLANRRPIVGNLVALFINDQQFARSHQFHSLARFDDRPLLWGERGMLRARLADRNERSRLRSEEHT